jgi:hypothetical protein
MTSQHRDLPLAYSDMVRKRGNPNSASYSGEWEIAPAGHVSVDSPDDRNCPGVAPRKLVFRSAR